MNRQEFLDGLSRALAGEVSEEKGSPISDITEII